MRSSQYFPTPEARQSKRETKLRLQKNFFNKIKTVLKIEPTNERTRQREKDVFGKSLSNLFSKSNEKQEKEKIPLILTRAVLNVIKRVMGGGKISTFPSNMDIRNSMLCGNKFSKMQNNTNLKQITN